MRLMVKVIRISRAKFHCNRLTTVQDIQHYASPIFLGQCTHLAVSRRWISISLKKNRHCFTVYYLLTQCISFIYYSVTGRICCNVQYMYMQPNASIFYVTLVDKSKLDSDLPKNISSLLLELDHVLAFSFLVWSRLSLLVSSVVNPSF